MKMYDVECPECKAMNRNLYLDDTDGWFECIECGHISKPLDYTYYYKIPCLDLSQVAEYVRMTSAVE